MKRKQMEDNLIANVQNHIIPILQKLRTRSEKSHQLYRFITTKSLQDLTSPYGTTLDKKLKRN